MIEWRSVISPDELVVAVAIGFLALVSVSLIFGPKVVRRLRESPEEKKRRKQDEALMKYVRKM